jgi:hypothetical protein
MNTQALISQAYTAFNKRDVNGTLALMSDNVSWPKASEGGRVTGKNEVAEYWTRQWADFDPHVEVLEVIDDENGKTHVKVHQLVKNREGDVLSDTELWHVYAIQNSLIMSMDILEADGNTDGKSAAFGNHGH